MPHLNQYIEPGDNADITMERQKATFNTENLAVVVYGKEGLEAKRKTTKAVDADSRLHNPVQHVFLSREERILASAKKVEVLMSKIHDIIDTKNFVIPMHHLTLEVFGVEGTPLALHYGMFIPALESQADDEQQKIWLTRARNHSIIGTYAQTEMGHGTNLKELETTATYDKRTQEFVLNSPTTTSMKWWPGNLGKSSNHCVLVAQLYIDGKKLGPHNFIVQLRDERTHQPLPGVTLGDIGPKMAYNTTDNGFLKLDHLRIPRRQMLMRHAKVAPDGTYTKPNHPKLGYATMVHVRSGMCWQQGMFLAMCSTIAIRYSAVRRQGRIDPKSKKEVQILDYQTQQHRLFPQIARAYAFAFAGKYLKDHYDKVIVQMKQGQADLLPDLHALSSGMKSVITHQVGQGIEQCRMSCGGHGYSAASRMPEIYGVQMGGCTYEGENMVMLLQTARYLMRSAASIKQGKAPGKLVEYLQYKSRPNSLLSPTASDDIPHLMSAFEHVARKSILSAEDRLSALTRTLSAEEAWNQNAVEMNRAARLHTRYFIAKAFHDEVHRIVDHATKEVLTDLLRLFLHYECLDMSHYLLADEYMNAEHIKHIKNGLYKDLLKLRPNAVSLVDAFDFSDRALNSVLGRRDGHVYDALYDWAKSSELNKTDVLPMFEKHLKPMMERGRELSKM